MIWNQPYALARKKARRCGFLAPPDRRRATGDTLAALSPSSDNVMPGCSALLPHASQRRVLQCPRGRDDLSIGEVKADGRICSLATRGPARLR